MTTNKINVLYLAYDGMTDPLGQSQVLSYLKELSLHGYSFDVIGFEKPDMYEKRKDFVAQFIAGYDIRWIPLTYHKSPPILSTVYDIWLGWKTIQTLCESKTYKIVHCRGYLLAGLGVKVKQTYGAKFIFDMRGWWPDEKLESGLWSSPVYKPVYWYYKQQEKKYFKASDTAISLTHIGKTTISQLGLKAKENVAVIPTCVNFQVFKPYDAQTRRSLREALNIPQDATVLLYSGSVGANYRTDLVLKFFGYLLKKEPNSILFFLSHSEHNLIEAEINKTDIPADRIRLHGASYNEVSDYLMVGDIGVVMYNTGFSVVGRSPTKLGEYWASGLTVLSAKGIGDLEQIINDHPLGGVLVDNLEDENGYENAIDNILKMKTPIETLRAYANNYFSLESGIEKYLAVYKKLIA